MSEQTTIHELFYDRRFHGPMRVWGIVELDGNLFLAEEEGSTLHPGEESCMQYEFDGTARDLLQKLIDNNAPVQKHPSRVAESIQNAVKAKIIQGDEIWDGEDTILLFGDSDIEGTQPVESLNAIPKKHLKQYAYRDCRQGTDDHDEIYEIIDGENKGLFLREYASRWQGSADYIVTLLSQEDVAKLEENFILY